MDQGASEERVRPRPNPFGEGRVTRHLLMGSRVITVSMWRGSPRGRARNEWELFRNRFKTNDLWKKVRLIWTLLCAIRIVDSAFAMHYALPPPFCFVPWSRIVYKTPLFYEDNVLLDRNYKSSAFESVGVDFLWSPANARYPRHLVLSVALILQVRSKERTMSLG